MKKIILLTLSLLNLISFSFAANFYPTNMGFIDNKTNIIEQKIEDLNSNYRLNFDVFVLKEDRWGCGNKDNYMDCIEEKVGIQSDGFFAINVNKRHMESWIRNTYNKVITTNDLKNFEENIVSHLGNDDWYGGIISYLDQLDTELKDTCNILKEKSYTTSCHLDQLLSGIKQQEKDYQQQLLQQEQERLEKEKERKAVINKITKYIPIIGTILIILNILYKKIVVYLKKKHYQKQMVTLLKDIKYLKIQINSDNNLLKQDKKDLYKGVNELHKSLEQTVSNFHNNIHDLEEDYNYYLNEVNNFHRDYKKKRNIDMSDINEQLDNVYGMDI